MRAKAMAVAMLLAGSAQAQTIYRCGNTYSDEPCAGAKEVDILPTEGAYNLSGTHRRGRESLLRDMNRQMERVVEQATGVPAKEQERQRLEREAKKIPRIRVEDVMR